MSNFYTYLWLREDGTPYYVGKGTRNRGLYSTAHNVKAPKDKERILIQEHPTEEIALEAEAILIAVYGRKDNGTGCLRNLTDGGDNPPKQFGKSYWRGKASPLKGRTLSSEHREKLSLAHQGKKLSSEHREKIRNGNRGKVQSEATRRKLSETQRLRWAERKKVLTCR